MKFIKSLGTFRLDCEYKIEYEYDFLIFQAVTFLESSLLMLVSGREGSS